MKSRPRLWIAASALMVAAFLATMTRSYHPGYGFTSLIEFSESAHPSEIAAVRNTPHYDDPPPSGYDGMFYAQLAVDPLLRDPAIDYALDNPPYRARRILTSWTAYALGLGRPAWILEAYALQNIVTWLALAWLLTRWLSPVTPRGFLLWSACLFSHGLVMSARLALPDGPSVLIIALGVAALETGRPLIAAIVLGLAGLTRETNLLAASMFARLAKRDLRSWLIVAGCVVLCAIPLALWVDYLRSIYRARAFESAGNVTTPIVGVWWKARMVISSLKGGGDKLWPIANAAALTAFVAQGLWVLWAWIVRRDRSPWTFIAVSFLLLGLMSHPVVWDGNPGAYTRVLLPLTVGANVLLARWPAAPWWLIAAVNLDVVPALRALTDLW